MIFEKTAFRKEGLDFIYKTESDLLYIKKQNKSID
jgi:hypothetical protein